jgi:two-component system OmpR family response regulator
MKQEIPKALIVDDEMDICFILSGIFKNRNVSTNFANSLAEAKVLMKIEAPSILFLDNHLPDGLGVQFLEYVKENYPETKIVMITAHDSPSDKHLALKNGADYFIGKPFSINTVHKAIDALMVRA